MTPNAPVGLALRRSPPPADPHRHARPFDGWLPEPADPTMDPLDRVLGRAMADLAFRRELLANPAAALAAEPMALTLKRALVGIRAETLQDFAARAFRARAEVVQPVRASASEAAETIPLPRGFGSLAGVGV